MTGAKIRGEVDQERLHDLREVGSELAEDTEILDVKVGVEVEVEVEFEVAELETFVEIELVLETLVGGRGPIGTVSCRTMTSRPSIPSMLPKFNIDSTCRPPGSSGSEKSTTDAGVSRSLVPVVKPVVLRELAIGLPPSTANVTFVPSAPVHHPYTDTEDPARW